MIRTEWPLLSQDSGFPGMESFSRKLRLPKKKIKDWTHHKSIEIKEKSSSLEFDINKLLSSSPSGILSSESLITLNSLQAELKKLRDHEILTAKLKSRMIWATLGDSNTISSIRWPLLGKTTMRSGD